MAQTPEQAVSSIMARPTVVQKCQCGHPSCKQYTLSSQGSVGFTLEDATLYAASHDLLAALADMIEMATHHAMPAEERLIILRSARAALAKARGEG